MCPTIRMPEHARTCGPQKERFPNRQEKTLNEHVDACLNAYFLLHKRRMKTNNSSKTLGLLEWLNAIMGHAYISYCHGNNNFFLEMKNT